MGKGDIKTKRGKRSNGSYGKHRPRNAKADVANVATKASTPKKKAPKKVATAKKEA